ncbi:hypothetical protein ACFLVG_00410 [Chloroflexota bacterium]
MDFRSLQYEGGSILNLDEYDTADAYLSRVTKRLKAEGFRIDENITWMNQTFEYTAKRIRLEIEKFGFVGTFFLFAKFSSLDRDSLAYFSAESFKYAEKVHGILLPRGLFYGIVCFPIAIVDAIDTDTAEIIYSKEPPKHWAAFEMPVVYSLVSKTLHYCVLTPTWGWIYYDQLRQTINNMLAL